MAFRYFPTIHFRVLISFDKGSLFCCGRHTAWFNNPAKRRIDNPRKSAGKKPQCHPSHDCVPIDESLCPRFILKNDFSSIGNLVEFEKVNPVCSGKHLKSLTIKVSIKY